MGVLSDQWRSRARELDEALIPLMKKSAVVPEIVQATKAAVVPEILSAFADMLQVLESSPEQNAATRRLQKIVQRNEQIRMAAVKAMKDGNWAEFDRIADSAGVPDDAEPSPDAQG